MSHTIKLTGSYGQTSYRVTGLDPNTTINADNASWIVDNNPGDGDGTNYYPFLVYSSPGVIIDGGTIIGEIDLTSEWRTVYERGNSAAIRVEGSPGAVIQDWRITQAWDAVRVSWNSNNFLIQDVWATDIRDDAVENDRLLSGTIRDTLFDGAFSGISLDPSSSSPVDGHNETVTVDGVLLRMESYLYEGEITHSSPIKTDSATNGTVTPNLRFINTVIAIEDVTHRSYRSLQDAWNNTIESSGNVFLNLSDTPLPADYPMPPAGWTVLQGQAARDYWNQARSTWIAQHEGTNPPPPPPEDRFPHAVNDSGAAASGLSTVIADVLANDTLGDLPTSIGAFDPRSTSGGAITLNGDDFTYTSPTGFIGTDTFNYTIRDIDGDIDTATVSVNVTQPSGLVNKRITSGLDDVEQRGRSVSMDSSDIELVKDGSMTQVVGLRFTGIEIPKGATITNAYIQFTADETGSSSAALVIRGNDVGDAAAFASTTNNVSSRAVTDASAAWNPAAWTTVGQAGLAQRTTDLSAIVDEIVDRADWASGNDLAFIFSGSGTRTADAFEDSAVTAPRLHVEYLL